MATLIQREDVTLTRQKRKDSVERAMRINPAVVSAIMKFPRLVGSAIT